MAKCKPHTWKIPEVGDTGLHCEACGRFIDFIWEMTDTIRFAIWNSTSTRYGYEAYNHFKDAWEAAADADRNSGRRAQEFDEFYKKHTQSVHSPKRDKTMLEVKAPALNMNGSEEPDNQGEQVELSTLSKSFDLAENAIMCSLRDYLNSRGWAWEAGKHLTDCKRQVKHGQWELELEKRDIEPRTARRFMVFHRDNTKAQSLKLTTLAARDGVPLELPEKGKTDRSADLDGETADQAFDRRMAKLTEDHETSKEQSAKFDKDVSHWIQDVGQAQEQGKHLDMDMSPMLKLLQQNRIVDAWIEGRIEKTPDNKQRVTEYLDNLVRAELLD